MAASWVSSAWAMGAAPWRTSVLLPCAATFSLPPPTQFPKRCSVPDAGWEWILGYSMNQKLYHTRTNGEQQDNPRPWGPWHRSPLQGLSKGAGPCCFLQCGMSGVWAGSTLKWAMWPLQGKLPPPPPCPAHVSRTFQDPARHFGGISGLRAQAASGGRGPRCAPVCLGLCLPSPQNGGPCVMLVMRARGWAWA